MVAFLIEAFLFSGSAVSQGLPYQLTCLWFILLVVHMHVDMTGLYGPLSTLSSHFQSKKQTLNQTSYTVRRKVIPPRIIFAYTVCRKVIPPRIIFSYTVCREGNAPQILFSCTVCREDMATIESLE